MKSILYLGGSSISLIVYVVDVLYWNAFGWFILYRYNVVISALLNVDLSCQHRLVMLPAYKSI